jgi:hypothetical protein
MYAVYTAGGRSPEDAVEQVLVDFRFGDSEVDVDSVCRAQEWMVPIYAKKAANLESNSKILRFRSWILEHERLVGEVASQIWTARQAERELLLLLRQARSRVLSHGIAGNKTATEAMLSAIKELNRIHRIGERSERDSMENTLKVIFMGEGDLE